MNNLFDDGDDEPYHASEQRFGQTLRRHLEADRYTVRKDNTSGRLGVDLAVERERLIAMELKTYHDRIRDGGSTTRSDRSSIGWIMRTSRARKDTGPSDSLGSSMPRPNTPTKSRPNSRGVLDELGILCVFGDGEGCDIYEPGTIGRADGTA